MALGTATVPTGRELKIIDVTIESEETVSEEPDRPPSARFGIDARPVGRPSAGAATSARRDIFSGLRASLGPLGSGLGRHGLVRPTPVSTPDRAGGRTFINDVQQPGGITCVQNLHTYGYRGQALAIAALVAALVS
jgi:hypothetical protein